MMLKSSPPQKKNAFLNLSVEQITKKMAVELGSPDLSNMAHTIVPLIMYSYIKHIYIYIK